LIFSVNVKEYNPNNVAAQAFLFGGCINTLYRVGYVGCSTLMRKRAYQQTIVLVIEGITAARCFQGLSPL